jgi:hypothetical protein
VWKHRFGLGCRSPGVLEMVPGALRNDSVIEVSASGKYLVSVSEPSSPVKEIVVTSCECQQEHHVIKPGSVATVDLDRGLYRVIAGRFAHDIAAEVEPVEVTIRALPPISD